jgi:hypothetical protein
MITNVSREVPPKMKVITKIMDVCSSGKSKGAA